MKKLEIAWQLKHGNTITSSYEGREHLDKIFQLKLSLPPKLIYFRDEASKSLMKPLGEEFSIEEKEQKANESIKQYLRNLTKELPNNLEGFIIIGFPPNPRKIKRALSLAYFIGKNIVSSTNKPEFKQV